MARIDEIECRKIVNSSKDINVLHTKFVLRKKKDESENLKRYEAQFVVCGNEESDYEGNSFSPVLYYTVFRTVLRVARHQEWMSHHIDFHNPIPYGKLDRPVCGELPPHLYDKEDRLTKVVKLQRSHYRIKDFASIRFELNVGCLKEAGLKKLETVPCLLSNQQKVVLCYVGELLTFAESENDVQALKKRLGRRLRLRDLGKPTQFLGSSIRCLEDSTTTRCLTNLIKSLL